MVLILTYARQITDIAGKFRLSINENASQLLSIPKAPS